MSVSDKVIVESDKLTIDGDSISEVVSFELKDNAVIVTELCDGYYSNILNREDLQKVIDGLMELKNKIVPNNLNINKEIQ